MWVPGGMFFLIPLIGILSRLLHDDEYEPPRDRRSTSLNGNATSA